MFLEGLDPKRFFTDYRIEGNCNYALTTLLKEPDRELFSSICKALREKGVEFRRGMSGGGNMLRQPFIIERIGWRAEDFPNADKVHHFGFYSGNYPSLEAEKIRGLCSILNHT